PTPHPYLSPSTNPCAPSHNPPPQSFRIWFFFPPVARKKVQYLYDSTRDIRSWTRLGARASAACVLSELPWCIMSYHIAFLSKLSPPLVSRG
ncbi:unnamed protein product, partial [Tuber aestivum]